MGKHTPGPWSVWEPSASGNWLIQDETDCIVARGTSKDTATANLRLIAAAPELLEALENYATRYLQDERDDPALCLSDSHHADVLACFAVIAKARGEQP
jgi:hypothetical protein